MTTTKPSNRPQTETSDPFITIIESIQKVNVSVVLSHALVLYHLDIVIENGHTTVGESSLVQFFLSQSLQTLQEQP